VDIRSRLLVDRVFLSDIPKRVDSPDKAANATAGQSFGNLGNELSNNWEVLN